MLSQIFMHLCLGNTKDWSLYILTRKKCRRENELSLISLTSRPWSDIHINLPALRKFDAILLEILNSFEIATFWHTEKGSMSNNSKRARWFRKIVQVHPQRKDEKW